MGLAGIVLQAGELFWLAGQAPFWESMMPTAIGRLPLALAYPRSGYRIRGQCTICPFCIRRP